MQTGFSKIRKKAANKKRRLTPNVSVTVSAFSALFSGAEYPLDLDSYQRPYVWGGDKVKQLLDDLEDYSLNSGENGRDYYMGSLLLHKNVGKRRLYIIDGQQRLTSLSILYRVLKGRLPVNNALSFHSPVSAKNIMQAHAKFSRSSRSFRLLPDLFDRICFTVIIVDKEDLAFTFFDTQNNRGVPLNATDILKTHHLRAINGENQTDKNLIQMHCAQRWEGLQRPLECLHSGSDFSPTLFNSYLWRGRLWAGQRDRLHYEKYEDIIDEFQVKTHRARLDNSIPLYATAINKYWKKLSLTPAGDFDVRVADVEVYTTSRRLPLTLRQPIHDGVGFFLYADNYNKMLRHMLNPDSKNMELVRFNSFYRAVIKPLSPFLREIFVLACLMHSDKFGFRGLFKFALWLDYSVGAIRISKESVVKQAPLIYLREKPLNILDVISGAFESEQIIDYLRSDEEAAKIYAEEKIESGKGVQGIYKFNIIKWYKKETDSLGDKALWIGEHLT